MAKSSVTEKTWIPLGMALVSIGGGSAWMTHTTFQASMLSDRIGQIENIVKKIESDVVDLKVRSGGSNGLRFQHETDSTDSLPGTSGESISDLSGRIHELRTHHEG